MSETVVASGQRVRVVGEPNIAAGAKRAGLGAVTGERVGGVKGAGAGAGESWWTRAASRKCVGE